MNNKFVKNLYQSLSYFFIIMIFVGIWILIFFGSYNYINYSWIFLCSAIAFVVLYFIIGFYWIFQTVTLNEEKGIIISLFKKVIKQVSWNEITNIEKTSHLRNPALRFILNNGEYFYLDDRNKIIHQIALYSTIK